MSEIKLISPMLDDFAIGDPISEHNGVRCCPAMPNDSDKRYIVKIISIPASQVKMEALLLTGACKTEEDALAYFHDLTQDVIREIETLQKLSKIEGFIPFEKYQVVQMEGEVGYDIYLLAPYKRSLERFFRRNTMTHLKAVNLGLDMCASLAVARKSGYMYVNLKPSNIYVSDSYEFRIGDLGFLPLKALQYATLPERYQSAYTAPEMDDPFASPNATLDIYAAGLILYQAYNDGKLPSDEDRNADQLPAPAYADYEMAEIILKACAKNPADRWQDPMDMGHAIVSYMQRNGVNETPIVTVPDPQLKVPTVHENASENAESLSEGSEGITEPEDYEQLMLESIDLAIVQAFPPEEEESPEDALLADNKDTDDEEDLINLSFMEYLEDDETAPDADSSEDITYRELSEETSDILSIADDLIAHETPEGVMDPEPIDVPMPPPIILDPPSAEDLQTEEVPLESDPMEAEEEILPEVPGDVSIEDDDFFEEPKKKKPIGKIVGIALAILLLIGLLGGGYYYYTEYYLQTIDSISLSGSEDNLNVYVQTDIDESLLTVICTNTYGEKLTETLTNGKATFSGLNANTLYTVKLEIAGLHQLQGKISASYTTPSKSNVVTFNAIAGSTDGSVILNFTVDGTDPDIWNVVYSAEGEPEKTASTTGHMTTITGLTVGKTYTFRLVSDASVYIVGNHTIQYTASSLIHAQNLQITGCADGILSAQWEAPADSSVAKWTVRCYNDSGYDQRVTTDTTAVQFTEVDCGKAYTVEVTADGMTTSERVYVSANSVTVANVKVNTSKENTLTITWENKGTAPEGNWLLLYTIDNGKNQEVNRTSKCSATISPVVPGATYSFSLQTESGVTVFNGSFTAKTPEAKKFQGYTVTADHMTSVMAKTGTMSKWKYEDWRNPSKSEYAVTSFAPGEKASVAIRLSRKYTSVVDTVVIHFVIRDAEGAVVSNAFTSNTWNKMFYQYNCTLDIPALPSVPGNYTLELYFDGMSVHEQSFSIT